MTGPTRCKLVGVRGFEPPAPASRRQCSTRLSYTPDLSVTEEGNDDTANANVPNTTLSSPLANATPQSTATACCICPWPGGSQHIRGTDVSMPQDPVTVIRDPHDPLEDQSSCHARAGSRQPANTISCGQRVRFERAIFLPCSLSPYRSRQSRIVASAPAQDATSA